MKLFNRFAILVLATLSFVACNKDDDDDTDNTPTPTYNFLNQPLQGEIAGVPWTYVTSKTDTSFLGSQDTAWATLYGAAASNPCNTFQPISDQVLCQIPLEVGVHEFFLDLQAFEGYTATLYDTASGLNNIAVEGAIEVLGIVGNTIDAQMDLTIDAENFINGRFTVELCN